MAKKAPQHSAALDVNQGRSVHKPMHMAENHIRGGYSGGGGVPPPRPSLPPLR